MSIEKDNRKSMIFHVFRRKLYILPKTVHITSKTLEDTMQRGIVPSGVIMMKYGGDEYGIEGQPDQGKSDAGICR